MSPGYLLKICRTSDNRRWVCADAFQSLCAAGRKNGAWSHLRHRSVEKNESPCRVRGIFSIPERRSWIYREPPPLHRGTDDQNRGEAGAEGEVGRPRDRGFVKSASPCPVPQVRQIPERWQWSPRELPLLPLAKRVPKQEDPRVEGPRAKWVCRANVASSGERGDRPCRSLPPQGGVVLGEASPPSHVLCRRLSGRTK